MKHFFFFPLFIVGPVYDDAQRILRTTMQNNPKNAFYRNLVGFVFQPYVILQVLSDALLLQI